MADLDPPQDSWFFQDDEPQPSAHAPRPGDDTPAPSEPSDAPEPEVTPLPDPPRPAAASDVPELAVPSEPVLEQVDSWLLGSETQQDEPPRGEALASSESEPVDPASSEEPATSQSATAPSWTEASAPQSAAIDSTTGEADSTGPVAIEFDPWMDGDGHPARGHAAETAPGTPQLIQGSWAEPSSARPSVPVRPFRWLGLGAAAAALAFAALELQGEPSTPGRRGAARTGGLDRVRRAARRAESPRSTGQGSVPTDRPDAQPGAHDPSSPRSLQPVGRSGGSSTPRGGGPHEDRGTDPREHRRQAECGILDGDPGDVAERRAGPRPGPGGGRADPGLLRRPAPAPTAPAAVRPARKEPAASPFLRDTLLQGPARMASTAVRTGAQQLLAASPLLGPPAGLRVGEAYRTWFLIQTDSLGTGAQLIADPFRRVTWCVGEPPSEEFLRERAARRAAPVETVRDPAAPRLRSTDRRAAGARADRGRRIWDRSRSSRLNPSLPRLRRIRLWVWLPDPVRSARQEEEAAGEPPAPWMPFGAEAEPRGEADRLGRRSQWLPRRPARPSGPSPPSRATCCCSTSPRT